VQAGRGGSPELRALAAARGGGAALLTEEGDDALDLHAFSPCDVASVVTEYLTAASRRGFSEVRLIHGGGIGVQGEIVRGVLSRHRLVESYADAPPERGGWGARIVRLRARLEPHCLYNAS
jgi:dsDNA-specific endonuclease/ATPase MutS2